MYTREQPFIIDSEEAASRFLTHFHGFHDGFIKRISLESNDYYSQKDENDIMSISLTVTEEIVLKIDIAHHNYGPITTPMNRGICLLIK